MLFSTFETLRYWIFSFLPGLSGPEVFNKVRETGWIHFLKSWSDSDGMILSSDEKAIVLYYDTTVLLYYHVHRALMVTFS